MTNRNNIKKYISRRFGFTLTELVVVISILAVLAAIVVPLFFTQINRARIAAHNANVATLKCSALLGIAENGIPEVDINWTNLDGTIEPGYDPDRFITEWPDLPEGLIYDPGFLGGSTTAYQVQIVSGGKINISPAQK